MFFLFFSDAKSDCWKGSGRGFADVMDRTLTEVQGGAGLGELVTYYQVLYLYTRVRHMTKCFHITSKNISFCPKGYNDPKKTDLKNH